MENIKLSLELLSSILSIFILIAIFYKYYQYKKKLDVLKGLDNLKKEKKLTQEDKNFIKENLKDYKQKLEKEEAKLKLLYPLFILIAFVLITFLELQEALTIFNVVIVSFIYLQIGKIHTKNFVEFLKELNED